MTLTCPAFACPGSQLKRRVGDLASALLKGASRRQASKCKQKERLPDSDLDGSWLRCCLCEHHQDFRQPGWHIIRSAEHKCLQPQNHGMLVYIAGCLSRAYTIGQLCRCTGEASCVTRHLEVHKSISQILCRYQNLP